MRKRNLTLVGPMGAGKSTIGRLLARELGLAFKDSDRVIEERTGASIPLIFELEGERGFRDREQQVIAELMQCRGLVLATGGGAILRPENRSTLVSGSLVVYLHTSVEHQLERTARDRNRPLLQTDNPRQVLEDLLKVREPLYREVADIIIETDTRPPRLVVQEILEQLDL
ncbi:MAG: shikimate kinase AroK [Gammaproteobacteria bacterium]|jgi:shikimate kinase|nr:shikimate kinase AroK [Gammaproteobacteria bacterium]